MKVYRISLGLVVVYALAGCLAETDASKEDRPKVNKQQTQVEKRVQLPPKPAWLDNPQADSGLAAAACVPATERMSKDSEAADIYASQKLGKGLLLQMGSLVDRFAELNTVPAEQMEDLVFSGVSDMSQVEAGYYELNQKPHFCSLVVYEEEKAMALLDSFVALASRSGLTCFTASQQREIQQSRQAFEQLDVRLIE